MTRYIWNVLIWIDQGFNTLLAGDPDETLSSRMGKYVKRRRGFIPCVICKMLDLIDKNHCIENIEADRGEQV